jgi:hypothetical protein
MGDRQARQGWLAGCQSPKKDEGDMQWKRGESEDWTATESLSRKLLGGMAQALVSRDGEDMMAGGCVVR